eukprot:CAMPEP_0175646344 /NCGR_PEP_ID=MMETSP0097-20121207/7274_1 /TAXON_ID=311494 /ORGANISM="Alexandrium monilatum, Strain CCMP3105" /LENGTH=220 /DNA_ID=CAMNT_0016952241 /DNA_START=74 /DNA_END=734 /DNA_ORIENTATION=+
MTAVAVQADGVQLERGREQTLHLELDVERQPRHAALCRQGPVELRRGRAIDAHQTVQVGDPRDRVADVRPVAVPGGVEAPRNLAVELRVPDARQVLAEEVEPEDPGLVAPVDERLGVQPARDDVRRGRALDVDVRPGGLEEVVGKGTHDPPPPWQGPPGARPDADARSAEDALGVSGVSKTSWSQSMAGSSLPPSAAASPLWWPPAAGPPAAAEAARANA